MNKGQKFFLIDEDTQKMWDKDALSMLEQIRTPELKRKELEYQLVKLVQGFQRDGLNIQYIAVDLVNGVDARVTLCPDPAENLAV
ncbi:hypothetical protein NRA68_07305 [Acinetobacter baumannii]|nr:hypothetical protein [Acinetobacter baumannii]